ncbi:TIGR00270 family protein [Candidatus Woesearchaeota archaeon]|nr:TIGR00270 family protein [Candidatus Woesearchaeota archaeon]
MTECELCGKSAALSPALIENTKFLVCPSCLQHGIKLAEEFKPTIQKTALKRKEEPISIFVEDFHKKIKTSREKLNLTQEELAKKLNEKVSIIHKLESDSFYPSINLVKKLENLLRITLIDVPEEIKEKKIDFKSDGLTIGDLIKLKRK